MTDSPLANPTIENVSQQMSFFEIVKNIVKSALFLGNAPMAGAFWFFRVLLIVSIMYVVIDILINKIDLLHNFQNIVLIAETFISIVILLISWFLSNRGINTYQIGSICTAFFLFHLGRLIKYCSVKLREFNFHILQNKIVKLIISFSILWILSFFGDVGLAGNHFTNQIFLIIVSISGWVLLSSLAEILVNNFIGKIVSYIGQQSKYIVIFHFLEFKPINYIVANFNHLEEYRIAAFPVLDMGGLWWILYTFVGVLIPVLFGFCIDKMKYKCKTICRVCINK